MKKLSLIFILALMPLLLTACTKPSQPAQPQDQQQETQDESMKEDSNSEEFLSGSIKDLLSLGKSVYCTTDYSSETATMSMKVYASGEKSYTETYMQDIENDENYNMYSVYDGEWLYTWGDVMATGTKMKVSDLNDLPDASENTDTENTGEGQSAEMNDQYKKDFNYKCLPWVVDSSKFVPPSDIGFVDLGSVMNDMQDAMESGDDAAMKDSACKACDSIPDAGQRDKCKSSLGC